MVDYTNINVLELWPIVVGLQRWYPKLRNCTLVIYTDNTQVQYMLTKGVSSNKICMRWLRELYWICVIYNVQPDVRYISTTDNVLADALSRLPYLDNVSYYDVFSSSNLCCTDELCTSHHRSEGSSSPCPET